ncbi:hypothetical protein D3C73_1626490 [compost metagenome]
MISPVMTRPVTPHQNRCQGVKVLSVVSMARFMSPKSNQSTGKRAMSESTPEAMTPL